MNSALICCGLAMLFYGLEIAVADWKLAHIHPRVLTFCYALGVACCAGVALLFIDNPTLPRGKDWTWVGLMVLASFVAALSHFAAITGRAGAVTLTLFYALLPVVAALFGGLVRGEWPSARMILAWALGAAALVLLATDQRPPPEAQP